MRKLMVTVMACGAIAGAAAAQSLPLRPSNLADAGFADARLATTLSTTSIAALNLGGEADRLTALLGSAQRTEFFAEIIQQFGRAAGNERARVLLNERADAIRQAVGQGRREAAARRSLQGRNTNDDAIDAAFATALAEADVYDEVAHSIPPAPIRSGFLPVALRSAAEARCFWGRRDGQTLAGATLSGNADRGAVAVDLFTDYFGGPRLNMGTAVSTASSQDSTDENIQRFMAAGGSAFLGVAWPLLNLANNPIDCDPLIPEPAHRVEASLQVILWPRVGFDLPAIGSSADDVAGNVDLGVDSRLVLAGAERRIAGYVEYRLGWVVGGRSFYRGIGYDNAHDFSYGLVTVGIALGGNYGFSATIPAHGPRAIRDRMQSIYGISLSK